MRILKLHDGDSCQLSPEYVGRLQVEALVEVEPEPEPRLVHIEEVPKPGTEVDDHPRVAVCKPHVAVTLGALAG
jgi:hypothetical protein